MSKDEWNMRRRSRACDVVAEDIEMERQADIRRCTRDLLMVERARE